MYRSRRVKAGANSSDITLFSLWFYSIYFYLLGVGITTNLKKVDNQNTSTTDAEKPGTRTTDPNEINRAEVGKAFAKRAEEQGTSIADLVEADRVETDGAEADRVEIDRIDKLEMRPADLANTIETDGADKRGTGIVNPAKANKAEVDGAEADGVDKLDTGSLTKNLQRQYAEL